jgi:hypothetical protein
MHDVGAKFALGDRFDGIHRKTRAKHFLEVCLESFTLDLLRALLCLALELLNCAAHGFDCLVLFDDLQPGCFIGLLAGFAANIVDRRTDALLDRELELALLFLQGVQWECASHVGALSWASIKRWARCTPSR